MEKTCDWCNSEQIKDTSTSVFWELPDGTRAIEILETPTIVCHACNMSYQNEKLIKQIEDQLLLINTANLKNSLTFQQLMEIPRLLKRNYFDFTS